MKRIWLITGVETGFGNSMTRKLLKTGNTVIGTVRNKEKVDVVVSNAGYGLFGTADEVANIAEILLSDKGQFITGSDFLIDGGATASYFYGPLQPNK